MTAPQTKPGLEESHPKMAAHGKMSKARARDAAVQVDVEDGQLAYLADSAIINFGLPPLAAALCTPARLRRLHHLDKIRLPSPRRKPNRVEAFAEILDWISQRIQVRQEELLKAHPKVVINHTQRVLDAEFGKLEKGLYPSLAADDTFLELLNDGASQRSTSRSLDDLWYSFPNQAQSPMSFDPFHGGQCLTAGRLVDCDLPMSSPRPVGSSACQHEQIEHELWLSRPNAFCDEFGRSSWSHESFSPAHSYHESPMFEMEHLSPEPHAGHGHVLQTNDYTPRPHALAMDNGMDSYLSCFPGSAEASPHGNIPPFLELPRPRRPDMSRSPVLLQRQQPWSPHSHT
jgi:hypothetical protein